MAFEVEYYPEQALIFMVVAGDISLEEYARISPSYWAVLESVQGNVDVLVDLRAMRHFPTSISQLRKLSIDVGSPKVGWIILITGDRPMLKFVATILTQVQTRRSRMRVFDSLENAVHFLKDIQPNAVERGNLLDDWYQVVK